MRSPLLALCLLAVVGLGAWRFLAPAPAPRSPVERLRSAGPTETVGRPKPTPSARPVEAPAAPEMSARRAQMEERFNELKEEGRRVRQVLIESDPKAAQAYNEAIRRPEYRALLDRRHQIEAAWAKAPESERDGMLNEMNSLRQQGFALIMTELQRMRSATPASVADGSTTAAPSATPPTPAPSAPVVFQ